MTPEVSKNDKAWKRLQALNAEIERHDILYFRESRPEISDFEYDCLQAERRALLMQHPEFSIQDLVGNDLTMRLGAETYEHFSPMLSLGNTYSKEELFAFEMRLKNNLPVSHASITYLLEPKVDGMAINLLYKNHSFFKGLTRGNGEKGEDITENVKTIAGLPLQLPEEAPDSLEIRGEVYLTQMQFEKLNQAQEALGLEPYANARNLAAGSLKLLDPQEVARRALRFIAHGIGFSSDEGVFPTQYTVWQKLKRWNFPVFEMVLPLQGIACVWKHIEGFQPTRKRLPYGVDGVVVKVNDRGLQRQLGSTAKAPRWAIAYKFEPESVETILEGINFQVGRTGVITPVAELKPVVLAGSRISRATLHNFDEVKRKDVRVGDYVIVQKAGEVIPAIVTVCKNKRDHSLQGIELPQKCPACGMPLVRLQREVAVRCTSLHCPPQIRLKIVHFASLEAMNIEGLGPKVVDRLVGLEFIHDAADLFVLKERRNALLQLERFSVKSVDNLLGAIEESKKNALWRLLHGLGVPNVGIEVSKNLAGRFNSLENLLVASREQLLEVDLVGETIADAVVQFFKRDENRQVVQKLKINGVSIESPLPSHSEKALWQSKVFVLTGTLKNYTRDEAKSLIEERGGRIVSKVGKTTFALIVGENPGQKLKDANKYGVPLWDEALFMKNISALEDQL